MLERDWGSSTLGCGVTNSAIVYKRNSASYLDFDDVALSICFIDQHAHSNYEQQVFPN